MIRDAYLPCSHLSDASFSIDLSVYMSTANMGQSGDTTHDHHVDNVDDFDMNDDDFLNDEQLNAAWR